MKTIFNQILIIFLLYSIRLLSQSTILPVELVYFKFQIIDSTNILLTWGTATETNCYGFDLERYSDAQWTNLGFVLGNNVSNSPKDYSFEDTTALFGKTYLYRLKQIDNGGDYKYSDTLTVVFLTGINKIGNNSPEGFSVSQNYPNPFNPTTNIVVKIPDRSEIILKVFDTSGRLVLNKNYGDGYPGVYSLGFDGSNLSSGVYFYTVSAGRFKLTRSMILIK